MEPHDPREFFNSSYALIERVVRLRCIQCRQIGMDADEFRSYALFKLVENEFRILRRYRGKSSLKTYLTTVVHRLFLDFRIHCWGKWRPSATAVELGPLATELERLLTRDEFTLAEASEWLRAEYPGVTDSTIEDLACRLPHRLPRRFEGEETLAQLADPVATEGNDTARGLSGAVAGALQEAWDALTDEDRAILELRYKGGLTVAKIARTLKLDQKPLYRRLDKLLRRLRELLTAEGITIEDIQDSLS